jgi:hypothetical protein
MSAENEWSAALERLRIVEGSSKRAEREALSDAEMPAHGT